MDSKRDDNQRKLIIQINAAVNVGAGLLEAGSYSEALKKFSSTLNLLDSPHFKPYAGSMNFSELQAGISVQKGRCYLELEDFSAAEKAFQRALEFEQTKYLPDAYYNYAIYFIRTKEWVKAIDYLKKVKNDPAWRNNALEQLAKCYMRLGIAMGTTKELSQALTLFQDLEKEEKDDIKMQFVALYHQAQIYNDKDFAKYDVTLAVSYYQACIDLYRAHSDILAKWEKSYVAVAAYNCAKILDIEGLEPDPKRMHGLFHISASLDCAPAWYQLGLKYQQGNDVPQSLEVAMDFYQQGCDLDDASCQTALGRIFLYAPEKCNPEKGFSYLTEAAEQKDSSAQQLLASYHPHHPAIEEAQNTAGLREQKKEIVVKKVDKRSQIRDMLQPKKIDAYGAKAVAIAISHIGKWIEKSRHKPKFYRDQLPLMRKLLEKASKALARGMYSQKEMQKIIVGASKFFLTASVKEHAECLTSFYQAMLKLPLDLDAQNVLLYSATRLDPALPLFKKEIPELIQAMLSITKKWDDFPTDAAHRRIFANLLYSLMHLDSEFCYLEAYRDQFKLFIQGALKQYKTLLENKSSTPTEPDLFCWHQLYLALLFFGNKYPKLDIDAKILEQLMEMLRKQKTESYISNSQDLFYKFLTDFFPDQAYFEQIVHTLPVDGLFKVKPNHFLVLDVRGPGHYLQGDEQEPVLDLKTRMHAKLVQIPGALPENTRIDIIDVPYFKLPSHSTRDAMYQFFSAQLLEKCDIRLGKLMPPKIAQSYEQNGMFGRCRKYVVQGLDGSGKVMQERIHAITVRSVALSSGA